MFFFQAEDGIRDAQESRGLGDVYKRQDEGGVVAREEERGASELVGLDVALHGAELLEEGPVSYTHLTLPTIYSV